jgi:hypothetical protein
MDINIPRALSASAILLPKPDLSSMEEIIVQVGGQNKLATATHYFGIVV